MYEIENLHYKYPHNDKNTLKGITFSIEKGEIFGLLGPNGVGKSTTQKILVKLIDNYRGKVSYKNRDLKTYGKNFYQEIGVGFEMPVHFSKLTARENLDFFSRLYTRKADINQLMKKTGLYADLDKKVAQFSKGMKVRLNFVRAMLNKPDMLFLDEPTSGLDPKIARTIKNMIRDYRDHGGTVLLTTHLMNDVEELCDRVAFMVDGHIEEINTPEKLKLNYGERKVKIEYRDNNSDEDSIKSDSFDLDTLGSNDRFFDIIKNNDIVTIHSGETNMDDIFIKVTGVNKYE